MLLIVEIFCNLLKETIELGLENDIKDIKGLDYLTRLKMILYIGIGLEKYLNYLTGFGLTLSVGLGLEKHAALWLPDWIWIDFV